VLGRVFKLTPLRKISLGFFLTVPAFLIPAWIQQEIDSGAIVNISWQLMAYVVMTAAEVFVSITCLEFSYTQAPKKMKSIVMAAYLLSVSLGNLFVSGVNIFIQTDPPAFKADLPGEYVLNLQGTDARTTVSDQIIIYVGDTPPPTEEANEKTELQLSVTPNKAGRPGEPINIFALGDSGKVDGETTYLWSADSPDVHFNIQGKRFTSLSVAQEGRYAISIEYKVGEKSIQKTLSLTISEQNLPPLVDAGPDQYLKPGSEVILDGSSSKDLLGEDILWKWQIVSSPTDSKAQLVNETALSSGSKLNPTQYYLFFAGLMFITALLFIPYAMVYKEKKYIQGDEENQESQPKQ
jgi:proton-dependent oligopeptide transporter, POT family